MFPLSEYRLYHRKIYGSIILLCFLFSFTLVIVRWRSIPLLRFMTCTSVFEIYIEIYATDFKTIILCTFNVKQGRPIYDTTTGLSYMFWCPISTNLIQLVLKGWSQVLTEITVFGLLQNRKSDMTRSGPLRSVKAYLLILKNFNISELAGNIVQLPLVNIILAYQSEAGVSSFNCCVDQVIGVLNCCKWARLHMHEQERLRIKIFSSKRCEFNKWSANDTSLSRKTPHWSVYIGPRWDTLNGMEFSPCNVKLAKVSIISVYCDAMICCCFGQHWAGTNTLSERILIYF